MSANPEYAKAKRTHDKAVTLILDAVEYLEASNASWNDPMDLTNAAFDAMMLLDKARKTVVDEFYATKKALGIGTYKPYGRDFPRRY